MNFAAVCHRSSREYVLPVSRFQLSIRLSAAREDLQSCSVVYWKRNDPENRKIWPMSVAYRDALRDDFRGEIEFHEAVRYIKYVFELVSKNGKKVWFSDLGFHESFPEDGFFEFLYVNQLDVFSPPGWAKGIVYYQIFPERFAPSENLSAGGKFVPWDSLPQRDNYFGGTLRGITSRIPWIQSLGADCIYLTPIFHADFNHKYATIDYFKVDPAFGTLDDLRQLIAAAHKAQLRVILDGVFNHVGRKFAPFADLLKNGERSPFRDWFFAENLPLIVSPLNYECVGDYSEMPKINTAHPDVLKLILQVLEYWVDAVDIDGWRLDVADEIEMGTLQAIRRQLKQKNPDLLLLGETWGDAFRLVGNGDQMDSAMNYLFRNALLAWFARRAINAAEFDRQINHMLAKYPDVVNAGMYNLLGSHDTARFLNECGGDPQRVKLAVAFQMAFCGSPAIYYGDEIGMSGENDPGCRGGMVWDESKQDTDLLAWYRRWIALRKSLPELRQGEFRANYCDPDRNLYGFCRSFGSAKSYVLINNSRRRCQVTLPLLESPGKFAELLSGKPHLSSEIEVADDFYNSDITEYRSQLSVGIEPYSVQIIKKEK